MIIIIIIKRRALRYLHPIKLYLLFAVSAGFQSAFALTLQMFSKVSFLH